MIHGNQYLLPFFIRKDIHQPAIQENDELTLAFYLLSKDLKKNEKILSFSRLLWPLLCVQGVVSTHIILDGLLVFSKKDKFSNPPRQPLIGHLLRNIDNRTKTEQLNKIIEVLTYKDVEAKQIGETEESEYQTLTINGLINPEFLQALIRIIPLIEYKPITEYSVLDTSITTESALDIAEQYRNIINTMKGNSLRWKTQIELIGKEAEKWLIDLNVQLKDIKLRYSSQISKTTSIIDPTQIDQQVKLEQDKIDQWNVNEKKKVIESISTLFKTAERHLEEMVKNNKFYSHGDTLKSKVYKDLLPHFENHFSYLNEEGKKFLESLNGLNQRFIELKERTIQIDNEAYRKLESIKESLNEKLKDRNKLLTEFQSEKEENISKLELLKNQIEKSFESIKEILQIKQDNCLHEAQALIGWSLNDDQSELFSRPIQWIYMPMYAMFIEDESKKEEYMNIIFPGFIQSDPNNIYEAVSNAFIDLKNTLTKKLEDDMAIRSNFEFSCERKNLIKDPNLKKIIQTGISKLRNKFFINELIERKIRESISFLP
ncbi:MAG: hypothetical protein ACFE8L_01835 [Candidatus Hodarchaeota archaeon]